ncbi:alkaline phosphatase family protein [Aestuariimicrobium ganziense]|uniref:alkaline phosphatase family protein n=1 Tax=Aestuariimicrobium ganziense TaxID=2773677 RepID=UPI001943B3FF|nr:nucleotide pyrophosphatase/phosphodiesterase family protein [Aestuariimicrobium ganziense]
MVLPSIGAHLDVPGCQDQLGLPAATRWVVLMVDGLGWQQLQDHRHLAAQFSDMQGRPISATVPSTTGTSLTSLGTGLWPGRHGMVGYLFRPAVGEPLVNAVTWDNGPDPLALQPEPTVFERATAAGVEVRSVVPARFENSGLTGVALRGTEVSGLVDEDDLDDRLQRTVEAVGTGERSLVYVYERALDHTGHRLGVDSPQWREVLRRTSEFTADLVDALAERHGDEVAVVVTGDHGMVDVPGHHRVIVEWEPSLLTEVAQVAGEGRMRQLYTESPGSVAARWRRLLGERAWVLRREEAIEAGWFGPVDPRVAPRIGDVLVAMRSDWAVMTTAYPKELDLVGMHGSLTPDEMLVPLLVEGGRSVDGGHHG